MHRTHALFLFFIAAALLLLSCASRPNVTAVQESLRRGELDHAQSVAHAILEDDTHPAAEKIEAAQEIRAASSAQGDLDQALAWSLAALNQAPDDSRLLAQTADLAVAANDELALRQMDAALREFNAKHLDRTDSLLVERARVLFALCAPEAQTLTKNAIDEAIAVDNDERAAAALQLQLLIAFEGGDLATARKAAEQRVAILRDQATPHDFALLGALRLLDLDGAGANECWNHLPVHWQLKLREAFGL